MARRRASRRRGTAGKRQMIWTALDIEDSGFGNASTTFGDIVNSSDWAAVGGFIKGAVLERIRGNISISVNSLATSSAVLYFTILRLADDEDEPNPATTTTYVEEDVLYQTVVNVRSLLLTSVGAATIVPLQIDVDVKSRRKLDGNTRIVALWRANAAGTNNLGRVSGILRGLVSLP